MSQIKREDIKKIAKLARIEVSGEKEERLSNQLNSIVEWVENLKEVNTDGVPALSNVHNIIMPLFPDEINDGNITEEILKNAADAKYNYFSVPKVIE